MNDAARLARSVLDRFEEGIAASDVDALMSLCTEDVVLFGSARANVGSEASRDYLGLIVETYATIRWHLDPIEVVHADEARVVVAGFGEVEHSEVEHGEVERGAAAAPERTPFRLTLVLARAGEDWRIAHFHGSVPEAD